MNKFISIVTPTYNQRNFIEQTIESVLSQKYANLEYIIIDGGSTDGTPEIIKKYEKHLKYWISEPDKGQASAINKGLKYCSGEIFNWLNSDDYLADGALHKIAHGFRDHNVNAVAGQTIYFEDEKEQPPIQLSKLNALDILNWKPGTRFVQPGLWMRRDLLYQCGGIDERFHYSFDWDLVIRYLYHFPRVKYLDIPLVYFRLHDHSKTSTELNRFQEEEIQILKKYVEDGDIKILSAASMKRLRRMDFYNEIEELNRAGLTGVLRLFFRILINPKKYANRISLGIIKNNLIKNHD